MSLLAYIWQTIMRKTHFGGTFFRFFTFGTAIHKRNITGQNTKSAIHKRDMPMNYASMLCRRDLASLRGLTTPSI